MKDYIKIEDKKYPAKLRNIKNTPKQLYIKGNYDLLENTSVAIVGSRECTSYGFREAYEFAKELSKKGICIISGLAEGIDTASHLGGMHQIGRTVAVLGTGLNKIFPEENEILAKSIIKNNGLIITEYEEGEEAKSANFPKRNRIMSGISDGVLVIEARSKSGSTITARIAKEQNKKVFCLPSNIDSKNGTGINELIKTGAILVTSPDDVLKHLSLEAETKADNEYEINDEYKGVYNCLSKTPMHINEICKKAKISMSETSQILTMLEIEGVVKSLPNSEFIKIK